MLWPKKCIFIGYDKKNDWKCMDSQTHRYVVSRDIMFDDVSSYYLLQAVFFYNINHNSENDICLRLVVEFPLSYSIPMNFDSSSSLSVSIFIISSSAMVEQSDKESNDFYEEEIPMLRR